MSTWTTDTALPVDVDAIPGELKRRDQWVVWRAPDKMPYSPGGGPASSTDPSTWGTFEDALSTYQDGPADGIGFVFSDEDPYVFVDLDDCFGADGSLSSEAALIVRMLDSYTERSPSGNGLHVLIRAKKPGRDCRKGSVEVYDRARYATVTGQLVGGRGSIAARSEGLEAVYNHVFGSSQNGHDPKTPAVPAEPVRMDDRQLLEKIRASANGHRFSDLYDRGNTAPYDGDHSTADAALVEHLLWWTQGDAARTDRLFRQSALMRPKWDERRGAASYGERTMAEILGRMDSFYDPGHRTRSARGDGQVGPAPAPPSDDFPLTDYGNAERLAARHGPDLRYCFPLGTWLVWDGMRWGPDDGGGIMVRAKDTARSIRQEAVDEPDKDRATKLFKHGNRTESESRLNAMISLARSEPGIRLDPDDLDADPFALNVANGTIDLRTGRLIQHERRHLITKLAPVQYDAGARAPRFYRFLQEIFDADEDLISYMQRLMGYSLTGDTREQAFPIFYGVGANGKSTLLEIARRIMGDYAMHTPTETLTPSRGGIPNDLARLRGARFVSAVETGRGRGLDENLIKQVTGGEPITARFLRKEWFEFRPEFKVFLATNHKPTIKGTDEGIWRRLHLVPFRVRIPKEKQDAELDTKLYEERAGILNWMVEGCLDWQREDLSPPAAVVDATATYRSEMDILAAFLEECCEIDDGRIQRETKASKLYGEYKKWCERTGEYCETQTKFGMHMTERSFERIRKRDGYWYKGIALRSNRTDPEF